MFESLSARLQSVTERLRGKAKITEADLDGALREIRLALLEADVNFKVVKAFVARVRERALGLEVLSGLNAGQQIVKIVHDELVATLGGERHVLNLEGRPSVLMLVGLQGSGKTTTAAKLAVRLRKEGRRPMLVAADVYRPAAVDQLVQLGDQVGVEVHTRPVGTPALEVARSGVEAARQRNLDLVILDTAGRLHVDEAMMEELVRIAGAVTPSETLLVVDAMTGQEAVNVAEAFHARLPVTGLVLTKMDGDARGGAALSLRSVTGVPIKFVGTGEKADALEPFHPDRVAQRILGMGDVLGLIERANEVIDQAKQKELEKKFRTATFNLEDFLDQMRQVQRMGPLDQLLDKIPGMGRMMKTNNLPRIEERQVRKLEAIILSMTPQERRQPEIIGGSRKRRIARGSGTTPADVNLLLNQFKEMQKMLRRFSQGGRGGFPGLQLPFG
jgi:signal recognition particle subunit SRP54